MCQTPSATACILTPANTRWEETTLSRRIITTKKKKKTQIPLSPNKEHQPYTLKLKSLQPHANFIFVLLLPPGCDAVRLPVSTLSLITAWGALTKHFSHRGYCSLFSKLGDDFMILFLLQSSFFLLTGRAINVFRPGDVTPGNL